MAANQAFSQFYKAVRFFHFQETIISVKFSGRLIFAMNLKVDEAKTFTHSQGESLANKGAPDSASLTGGTDAK